MGFSSHRVTSIQFYSSLRMCVCVSVCLHVNPFRFRINSISKKHYLGRLPGLELDQWFWRAFLPGFAAQWFAASMGNPTGPCSFGMYSSHVLHKRTICILKRSDKLVKSLWGIKVCEESVHNTHLWFSNAWMLHQWWSVRGTYLHKIKCTLWICYKSKELHG